MNQFSFRSRIRLGLILLITCLGLIWSSGFVSANASEGEDKPQNLIVAVDGDAANISWSPGQSTANLDGYEIMAIQTFVGSQDDMDTVHNGVSISIEETENTYTFEHLSPGGWQFAIKAIYNDHQSGFQVSGLFTVSEPIGIISRNFQKIYPDIRSEFIPSIAGVPDYYTLLYRVNNTIVKKVSLENYNVAGAEPVSITWNEIYNCINIQAEINVEIVYLSSAEDSAIDGGCDDSNLTIANYADRIVGNSVFNFETEPIPRRTAYFAYTSPDGVVDRIRPFQSFENDSLTWPLEPVINTRNPRTGAKFLGWMNSSNEIVSSTLSPIANMTYTQSWEIYPEPLVPLEIQIGDTTISYEELSEDEGPYFATWENVNGELNFDISLVDGVTYIATIYKADGFLMEYQTDESLTLEDGESVISLGSESECSDVSSSDLECAKVLMLGIRTESAGNGFSFVIYLLRQQEEDAPTVRYHFSEDQIRIEDFDQNEWSFLQEPDFEEMEHFALAKWCKEENPSELNEENLHCRTPDELFAVTEDLDLYPLWIDSLVPDEIAIGDRVFDSDDWIVDPENNILYLTVISNNELPLSGEIDFRGPLGLTYEPYSVYVEDLSEGELLYLEDFGFDLSSGCSSPNICSKIFAIEPDVTLNGFSVPGYNLLLISTSSTESTFNVNYELLNGQDVPVEEKAVGWYQVPSINPTREGYEFSNRWEDSIQGISAEWETYFPVIEDETLTLLWIPTNDQNSEQANENSNQNPGPEEPNQSNQPTLEFPRLNEAPMTNTPLVADNSTSTDLEMPQNEIEVISSSAINSKKVSKRNGRIEIRASLSSQYSGKVAKLKIGKKGKAKRITLGKIKLNKKANGKFPPISYAYAGKKVGIYVGGKEVFSFVLEV